MLLLSRNVFLKGLSTEKPYSRWRTMAFQAVMPSGISIPRPFSVPNGTPPRTQKPVLTLSPYTIHLNPQYKTLLSSPQVYTMLSPPGFQAFNPYAPVHIYRRNLPHWRQPGTTYFVTFHTIDSLPQQALDELQQLRTDWLAKHRANDEQNKLQQLVAARAESWLDQGHGRAPFHSLRSREVAYEALQYFHKDRVHLGAFVIMPNHVHVIARPLGDHSLEKWLGSVKGFSTRQVNKLNNEQGPIWGQECFDRIIRDTTHLNNCIRYIGRNPSKANLDPHVSHRCWLNPDWEAIGYSL